METTRILWRDELDDAPRRGRPPRASVADVVRAGVTVADARGTLDFTLRDVADEVGLPVMTLYSYVSGRDQLIDLMADHCRGAMSFAELHGSWRNMLQQVAAENLAVFSEHPWLAHLESERAILGPGTLAKYERELGAVESLPVSDVTKDAVLTLVTDFVRAASRSLHRAGTESCVESAEDWWSREGAVLGGLDLAARFPLSSRIGTSAGEHHRAAHSSSHAYRFGLGVILDGLERTMERPVPRD